MSDIPKLKKKISSFLTKEDGKISKEGLIKAGILIGVAGSLLAKSVAASHDNQCSEPNAQDDRSYHCQKAPHVSTLSISKPTLDVVASHAHSPATYAHNSHGSHGSHCAGWVGL